MTPTMTPTATYPDPTVFGHDPWWLMLAKALAVFVFLLLTVLVAILVERKLLGRMQLRYGPRPGPPRVPEPRLRAGTSYLKAYLSFYHNIETKSRQLQRF